jgi:hypothetical protein
MAEMPKEQWDKLHTNEWPERARPVYPRPVTSDTFEAEFVAFNEFRKLCGVDPVPRVIFQGIVARHNATIASQESDETLPA